MVGILALGAALPATVMTNAQLESMVDTSDEWITTRTGIKSRRIVDWNKENSTVLSADAARVILKNAGAEPSELGGIICATLGGDYITPSLACSVMGEIGASCPAFDINAACSGYMYALEVASRMFTDKPILVIGCDLLSRFTNWRDRSTCVLFGDAAGGCLIGAGGSEIVKTYLTSEFDGENSLYLAGTNYKQGGALSQSAIVMDGPAVYRFATQALANSISKVLELADMDISDVDWIIPHQANLRITQSAANRLGVPDERFFINIDHVGNTSSASIPVAFYELWESGRLKSGQSVVLAAFGGGWTTGAALIKWA